ncbi:Ig-like domain-containing protein [Patescibacteria group bacterium]
MAKSSGKTRLQRKKEKDSLKQAVQYLLLIFVLLFLLVRFGLPALINMAAFIGDLRSTSQPIEKQDSVPPMTPKLAPLPEATYSAQINIAGYGEAGSTVELYLRGINVEETVVNEDGNFEFKDVRLRDGENEVYVKAVDDQGNESNDSDSYTVTVDGQGPELSIDSPDHEKRFFDKDSPIVVKGSTEEDADIRVNGRFVMVKNDGSYETKVSLSEGDNEIEVIATDRAGNQTREAVIVNYTP